MNFGTMPAYLEWLSYASYVRYSFEGVLQAIYGFDRPELICDHSDRHKCVFMYGEAILRELDVHNAKFYLDFIILCVFFVVLRIGCYIVLRWRVKVH